MRSFLIVHPSGRTTNKTEFVAPGGVGVQTCYQRVCSSTPGHWDSGNPALALSLRCCRATVHTSSAVLRFTNMLLFPRPFGSRLVVHLGVICPELRPPLVAIHSARDTAHGFPSSGSPTVFVLRLSRSCSASSWQIKVRQVTFILFRFSDTKGSRILQRDLGIQIRVKNIHNQVGQDKGKGIHHHRSLHQWKVAIENGIYDDAA